MKRLNQIRWPKAFSPRHVIWPHHHHRENTFMFDMFCLISFTTVEHFNLLKTTILDIFISRVTGLISENFQVMAKRNHFFRNQLDMSFATFFWGKLFLSDDTACKILRNPILTIFQTFQNLHFYWWNRKRQNLMQRRKWCCWLGWNFVSCLLMWIFSGPPMKSL